ncbi:hypothetical protein EVG20_g10877 [Dentipellis fragilis]|uniref:F-box domain-containing protein n=1 Tax=Dentipellis fragilis TaxID=205917 RepID=A0A4Y9XQP2_9AGAM|nr:hypothetical protein EVG20_g10877 [Dentipellis fragilis]
MLSIIPSELLVSILVLLDHRDLLHCSAVCRYLNETVKNTPELRYVVELVRDGMSDGPPSDLSAAERLQLLLERREKRRTLNWERSRVILPSSYAVFGYQNGAFAMAVTPNNVVGPISSILVTVFATNCQPERLVVLDNLDVAPVKGFLVDPALDLVVLLMSNAGEHSEEGCFVYLHLRSLSSSAKDAYPDCHDPIIKASLPDVYQACPLDLWAIRLQVTNDLLGLYLRRDDAVTSSVFTWDWKSGAILAALHDSASMTICDFSFISQSAFLVTVAPREEPLDDEGQYVKEASFRIYNLGDDPSGYNLASPAVIMYLPPVPVGTSLSVIPPIYWDFTAYSGPFTTLASSNCPFMTSESARIHVFDVEVIVYGSILAQFERDRPNVNRIMDFNIEASKDWELVTEPTILKKPQVFAKPVTTSLPYRQVVIPVASPECCELLLDDERLISVEAHQ